MSDATMRDAAADGGATNLETTAWFAIGNAGAQVSNERIQPAYSAASGSQAALSAALAFTGAGGQSADELLVYDASTAGTLRFSRPLSGDLAFNASGELTLTAADIIVA